MGIVRWQKGFTMIYSLAARAYLMFHDYNILPQDAVYWVTRRLPKGLRAYYRNQIFRELRRASN